MLAGCERKKAKRGVPRLWRIASVAGRRVDGVRGLGDESGLGEEAAFLFLGLAVDGDLDSHLGCVLGSDVSDP
jgi:hypothetical protein